MVSGATPQDCETFLNLGRRKSQASIGRSVKAWRSNNDNTSPAPGIPVGWAAAYRVTWPPGCLVILLSGYLVIFIRRFGDLVNFERSNDQ
jgi:hypothetical protein